MQVATARTAGLRWKSRALLPENPRQNYHRSTVTLTDSSVLRGTTASVLLGGFGQRLRSTAGGIGFTTVEAEDEFNHSFQVEELDMFLSHSWHAHWALKYFTLLFYFNALPAVALSLFVAVLCCGIRFIHDLRNVSDILDGIPCGIPGKDEKFTQQRACTVVGSIVFFIVLFFWQHFLSCSRCTVTSLFLDKVCIHQTDQDKKAKGIKSIGAILGKSQMVLVAWDPTYFSRLWCTFELAAYKHARPTSQVVVLPVDIGGFIAALIACSFANQVVVIGLKAIPEFRKSFKNHLAIYLSVYLFVALICTGFFRSYVQELLDMNTQLKEFSVRDANCFCCSNKHLLNGVRLPCDRKLVNASIEHWHGDGEPQASTTLTQDASEGATELEVASTSGFQAGHGVIIDAGTSVEEVNSIVGYDKIILKTPLRNAHQAGGTLSVTQAGLDKFDELIRGTFRSDIAQAFRGSRVPYHFVLLYSVWAGFYQLDRLVPANGRYKSVGRDEQIFDRSVECFHTVFLCYPMNLALFINFCKYVFSKVEPALGVKYWWQKRITDVICATCFTGLGWITIQLAYWLLRQRTNPALGVAWCGVEATIVYLLYRRNKESEMRPSMSEIRKTALEPTRIFRRAWTTRATSACVPCGVIETSRDVEKNDGEVNIELAKVKPVLPPPPFFESGSSDPLVQCGSSVSLSSKRSGDQSISLISKRSDPQI